MHKLSTVEQKFKAYLIANGIQPFSAITEEELKKEAALFDEWAGELVLPYQELHVKVRDDFPVRIRVFNPELEGKTFFFSPGNGYCVVHNFNANTAAAARIAKAANQRVVIINFRLMPTYPWPTPIQDVHDVIRACVCDHAIPNVDPNKVSIGGFSGGAHASLLIALDQDRGFTIQNLILLGGPYDFTFKPKQYIDEEGTDYICKRNNLSELAAFWKLSDQDMTLPEYSPLFAKTFKHLPKTFIIVGELDGIRGDSEALYAKLQQENIKITKTVLPGQTHNNITFNKVCGDENDGALVFAKILLES